MSHESTLFGFTAQRRAVDAKIRTYNKARVFERVRTHMHTHTQTHTNTHTHTQTHTHTHKHTNEEYPCAVREVSCHTNYGGFIMLYRDVVFALAAQENVR